MKRRDNCVISCTTEKDVLAIQVHQIRPCDARIKFLFVLGEILSLGHKQKHKHKKNERFRSSYAYAYTYVALFTYENGGDISINKSARQSTVSSAILLNIEGSKYRELWFSAPASVLVKTRLNSELVYFIQ